LFEGLTGDELGEAAKEEAEAIDQALVGGLVAHNGGEAALRQVVAAGVRTSGLSQPHRGGLSQAPGTRGADVDAAQAHLEQAGR
jgi:hypothetical protein